jgi:hypothetical protein
VEWRTYLNSLSPKNRGHACVSLPRLASNIFSGLWYEKLVKILK